MVDVIIINAHSVKWPSAGSAAVIMRADQIGTRAAPRAIIRRGYGGMTMSYLEPIRAAGLQEVEEAHLQVRVARRGSQRRRASG